MSTGQSTFFATKKADFRCQKAIFGIFYLFIVSLKYQVKGFFAKIFGFGCRFPSVFFPHSKISVSLFCWSWIVVGYVTNAVKDDCAALVASKLVAFGNP